MYIRDISVRTDIHLDWLVTFEGSDVGVVGLWPGLSGLRQGRSVGLPHGHRLLGQEVRLHVGRRQERHEGHGGSPGGKIFEEKSQFYILIFQKTADLTYSNEIPTSVYNPSGMYGLKAMGVSLGFFLNFNLLHTSKLGNNLILIFQNNLTVTLSHRNVSKIRIWWGDILTPFIRRWQNMTPLLSVLNIPLYLIFKIAASQLQLSHAPYFRPWCANYCDDQLSIVLNYLSESITEIFPQISALSSDVN